MLKYLEIGSVVAMVLFGISTVQVYMYFWGGVDHEYFIQQNQGAPTDSTIIS
jgi:hypothetical protein